ncbi:hypothetical protein IWQ61_007248 [Dispira simplex]|nr:hypothetical protein IWQ61_007248 [Dispira simplex]
MGDNNKNSGSSVSKCLKCSNPAIAGKFWCIEHGCAHPGCGMSGNGKFCPIHKDTVDDSGQLPISPAPNVPLVQEPVIPRAALVPSTPSPVEPRPPAISLEPTTVPSPKAITISSPPFISMPTEPIPPNRPPISPVYLAARSRECGKGNKDVQAAVNNSANEQEEDERVVYHSASKVVVEVGNGCTITMPKRYVPSDDEAEENGVEKPIMIASTNFSGQFKLQVYCSVCNKFRPTSSLKGRNCSETCNNTFAAEYLEME